MDNTVDPKTFGLHRSTVLERTGRNRYAIVIRRKSRIIMKDGEKILDKAGRIRAAVPDARVAVRTSAPVCSKTREYLETHGIHIEKM